MDLPGVQSASFPSTLRPPGMAGLPVVPPPPPKNRPAQKDFAQAFSYGPPGTFEALERGFDQGPHTPGSQMSGTGQFGITPPTGPGPGIPGFPSPGGPPSGQRTPPPGPGPAIPGFPSPSGTPSGTMDRPGSGSLGALRQAQQQSLSEQVKAGTDRANKPPPPKSGSGANSRTGSRGSSPRASPAPPSAPAPTWAKSRPTSASSSSKVLPSPGKAPPMTPPGNPDAPV